MGQLETAKRVFAESGVNGVLAAIKDRYLTNRVGLQLEWCYGRSIEIRGNTVEIDGCAFSLDSPVITTASKGKFMFDRYERPERNALQSFVDPDLPVIELGGSIGVVSCLTNRLLNNPKNHVVVEANPNLVPLLIENRDRNKCQFSVLPRVVGYGADHITFYTDNNNFVVSSAVQTERCDQLEAHDIRTINVDAILDENNFERCTLICDIEGGESDLLQNEAEVLKNRVSTLILEVHEWSLGKERVEEMLSELSDLGFQNKTTELDTYTFQKTT